MKTALTIAAVCAAVLQAWSPGAMSAERLPGQVTLVSASSGCSAAAISEAVVAVKLVLPPAPASDASAKPVNRFRYNYQAVATPSRPMITGEIHDFGAPGCTVAFAGKGIDID